MSLKRVNQWIRSRLSIGLIVPLYLSPAPLVPAQEATPNVSQPEVERTTSAHCPLAVGETFENIQIETADLRLHEQLFESVFHAALVQSLDHPQIDRIRAYCYRHVLVVIRQDLRTPRPTGWVQLNFVVKDVAALHQELEVTARTAFANLDREQREQIVRFRMKPGVMRNHRKVDRLEVYGPEGFLVGFDQSQ
ncbi:MAG: hypothetical protein JSR31_09185 [Nitrospira sp.]|nr:hypothetical protein [Nitrospira sp.]